MKTIVAHLFVALMLAALLGLAFCVCDDSSISEKLCYELVQEFEDALYEDKGNTYRLRKAFFYAPNAHPVLMKVIYNITFAANDTMASELDYCDDFSTVRKALSPNETAVIFGWTSNGIFTVVHPLVVNFMQMQLPFVLLRIFYYVLESERGPEAQTFLWDGTYDLPTLQINLTISSRPCIPDEYMFMSALKDFNSLIRVYAGRSDLLEDSGNTHLVGFSLPRSSVSGQGFRDESYTPFYLVYVISSIVLYVLCVTTALFIVSKSRNDMKKFTNSNTDVLVGLTIVMSVFIILEVITEIIMAIVWSNAVKDPVITVYVVLSTALYCIPGIVSVCNMAKEMYSNTQKKTQSTKKDKEDAESQTAHKSDATKNKSITTLPLYSFIWLAAYFAYLLLYAFFPAFILAFAYPIRVISIFVFMATFMVLFTVSVITYLKRKVKLFPCAVWLEKKSKNKYKQDKLHLITKVVVGIFITLNFLYFFLFVFGLLYSLIIGKASVVSSAPLALLSLLPSILVSAMAWVIKKSVLDDGKKTDEKRENASTKYTTSTTEITTLA